MTNQISDISKALKSAFEFNQAGNYKNAEKICQQILSVDSRNAGASYLLGLIASQTGKIDKAINLYKKSIQHSKNNAWPHIALGNALKGNGQLHLAVTSYKEAIAINPNLVEAHFNLGNAYQVMGAFKDAVNSYQNAIRLKPDFAGAHNNLGNSLKEQGLFGDAAACFKKAASIEPGNASMQNNLGNALSMQGRPDLALECYRKAIMLKPDYADAYNHLGEALLSMGNVSEAIVNTKKSLSIKPDLIDALINLGNAFTDLGNLQDAVSCYQKALLLNPDNHNAHSNFLLVLNYFPQISQEEIFRESLKFDDQHTKQLQFKHLHPRDESLKKQRLRIGYISPDFREHSIAYFIEPLLKYHNSKKFEVYCYSDVKNTDTVTERLQSYADHWVSIYGKSNEVVDKLIRDHRIDILIDLAGHTANNRLLVLANKPSPIQISWLGYPNTTGLSSIDYRLTDSIADPKGEADNFHSEELIRLVTGFLCYRTDESAPAISDLPFLKNGYITFGSFNNTTKISPEVIKLWSKILNTVSDSQIILKSKSLADKKTQAKYRQLFTDEGISADRIELHGMLAKREEHLRLYNRIDVALDPFPYNGTTTTCEALWMGVPVVTLYGERHAGRVGASIINRLGLNDALIAKNEIEYVHIASRLAKDVTGLAKLRSRLRDTMINSPLCDAHSFTENLEEVFLTLWRRYFADKPQ
jgi:predicted O-linked N-acetylglucosamine transferase (SPINDLY family)